MTGILNHVIKVLSASHHSVIMQSSRRTRVQQSEVSTRERCRVLELPQELINMIIDHLKPAWTLHRVQTDLSSTSQVCRAFLQHSQELLFAQLIWIPWASPDVLSSLLTGLEGSPHLATYTQTINIRVVAEPLGLAHPDTYIIIARILPLLKKLKSLRVWGLPVFDWENDISIDLRQAIAATIRFKSLTHVTLTNIVNFDARILTSCSSLHHLVLRKTFAFSTGLSPSLAQLTPKVLTVLLRETTTESLLDKFVLGALPFVDMSHLRRLIVRDLPSKSSQALSTLFQRCASTLVELDIYFYSPHDDGEIAFFFPSKLFMFPTLLSQLILLSRNQRTLRSLTFLTWPIFTRLNSMTAI